MLHRLRAMVRSWFAKLLIALLVLSFAAWGIGDVFISRASNVVAQVGAIEITTDAFANRFRVHLEQRGGAEGNYSVADALEAGLDQQVITELAEQAALEQAAQDLGLSAPDAAVAEAITATPAFFDASGAFDPARYARLLAANGYSHKDFEARVRRDVARAELIGALFSGTPLPAEPLQLRYEQSQEQRRITYFRLGNAQIETPADPDEDAIRTYLDDNASRFRTPERRSFSLLWLSPDELAEPDNVPPDEARDYYEVNRDLYGTPETRTARQSSHETRAAAQAFLDRLAAGESFLALAAERGLTEDDIALGRVARDELPPALAGAVFDAPEAGPIGPVETAFGWSVLELVAITAGTMQEFDAVKEEIRHTLAREAALDRIPELAAAIEDQRAAGATLEEVAEAVGATLRTFSELDRFGVDVEGVATTELPADEAFLTDVFESPIDADADLLDLADGGAYLVRVDAIAESRPQDLDEVRDQIVAALLREARADAVQAAAEDARAAIAGGTSLEDAAAELDVEPETPEPFLRSAPPRGIGADLNARIFALDPGGIAAGSASFPGAAAVVRLEEILPADVEEVATQVEGARISFGSAFDVDAFEIARQALQDDFGVSVNRASIDAALGVLSER